jgi:hypothetical protein
MIEGSGSIPLRNGSGRPKNTWFRWIRNTGLDVALPGGRPARRAGPGKVGRQQAEHVLTRVLRRVLERGEQGDETEAVDGLRHQGWKKPGFFFLISPVVFFLGFLGVFWFLYIFAQKREAFLGFFQFQEYF